MKLAIIINSYNRLKLLQKCIETLLPICKESQNNYFIHLLDAGSTDGSIDFIEGIKNKFDFVSYEIFSGATFSQGCNQAVRTVQKLRDNISAILLFETDNFLYKLDPIRTATKLIHSSTKIGCVGFTITNIKGQKLQPGSKFLSPFATVLGLKLSDYLKLEKINDYFKDTFNGYNIQEYQVIYTSPLLISMKVWNEVGGMDEELFPFCESDSDLLYRIHKSGFKSILIQCDGVVHDNLSSESQWSEKRVFDLSRARLAYMRKHNGVLLSIIVRPLLLTRHFIEAFYLLIYRRSLNTFFKRLHLSINSLLGYA